MRGIRSPASRFQDSVRVSARDGGIVTEFPAELNLITQTYIQVRYGEVPEQDDEVQAIEAAWERINEQGLKLKRTGQRKLQTAETKEVLRTGV